MRKNVVATGLSVVLALSLGLTGCSGSSEEKTASTSETTTAAATSTEGQTLIIQDSDWEGIDQFQVTSWNDMQCLLADQVINKDPVTNESIPGIASQSVWSEDGLTWTLTFPEGMYYCTGEQVEPEDFVASIEYGLEISEYADGYSSIIGMEIDGRDVIMTLSEFQADMESNFQSPFIGIIDKDELDSMSKDEMLWGCHPYGPYYLDSYEPGAYAVLKANEGYMTSNPLLENKGVSPVKEVKVYFSGEAFTFAQGIQNGDYDVLAEVPSEYYEELVASEEVTVIEAAGATIGYTEFNMTDPLFEDERVREAIIRAFSRENLAMYLSDFESPAYSLVVSKCLNYSDEAVEYYKENYGYDLDAAKQLLADAGWTDTNNDGYVDKDGQKFSFTFSCRDSEYTKKIAQSLQVDLMAAGIDMQITTQDWSYVNQDVKDGNFQMAYLGLGWSEPFLLVDMFCQRNPELTNPDSEGQIAMVAEARKVVDYNERTDHITEIQKKLFDYKTIMPLVDVTAYRCYRSEIQGIVTTPTGGFFLNDIKTDANGNFRNVQ